MSEDQEWSRRVLRAGRRVVYEPDAAVHHSHAYSVARALPPLLRLGRLGRALVRRRPSRGPPWKAGLATRRASSLGSETGQRRWIPYAAVYELAKFAGLQLGRRHRSSRPPSRCASAPIPSTEIAQEVSDTSVPNGMLLVKRLLNEPSNA